jgi:pantoate--beta-alanine ligase
LKVLRTNIELAEWLAEIRRGRVEIGFVPTMGALHKGHIELVKTSIQENDYTIVSIFINPKQFNSHEDFEKYPVTIDKDLEELEKEQCDAVFIPGYKEVYPDGLKPVKLDMGHLETVFEGPVRPGHFNGVVQVVKRFFELVEPTTAYFGLKDFQQCMVVKKLRNEYFPKVKLQFCPTMREESGLAMSSRNERLSAEGKLLASRIFEVLSIIKKLSLHIEAPDAIKYGKGLLHKARIEVEYLELANVDSFVAVNKWQKTKKNVLLIAAYIEGVRLIDNVVF